jgi:predicted Ser/Thr protein kinase
MIGTTLSHYKIEQCIGQGGMGVVYRATDTRLGRVVAIKVIAADSAGDRDRRDRFLREARAASALNHPNIVTIHEVDHANGIDFLVMELVAGRPLNEIIPESGLPLERAIGLAEQIADALVIAHAAGIVHRDVKPANIVISDSGQAKMLDFGLAKLLAPRDPAADTMTAAPMTELGVVVGTIAYMSPEQAQGLPISDRSDIFSFGAVLYEMLAGRRPFGDGTIAGILTETPAPVSSVRKNMVPALDRLIADCLNKAPARRPSARDVADRLSAIKGRVTASRLGVRVLLQRRAVVAVLLGIAVAALALGSWWWRANARVRWARTVVIPRIHALSTSDDMYAAYMLTAQARTVLPDDAELAGLWDDVAFPATITTDPPGAEISIRPYSAQNAAWYRLGQSPLKEFRSGRHAPFPDRERRVRDTRSRHHPGRTTRRVHPQPLEHRAGRYAARIRRPGLSQRPHGDPRRILDRQVRGNQPAIQDVCRRRRISHALVLDRAVCIGAADAVVGRSHDPLS